MLQEYVDKGLAIRDQRDGAAHLATGPKPFEQAFHICDHAGRGGEFLTSEYARQCINDELLVEVTKAAVRATIYNLLRLITSDVQEVREDPQLSAMGAWLDGSEQASEMYAGIIGSLSSSGFHELLELSLLDLDERAAAERRLAILEDLSDRDVTRFFSPDPPIPNLPEIFLSALFPDDERDELFEILRSSPSAMRALLLANNLHSGPLTLAFLQQTLPILERLFEVFAQIDPKRCGARARRALGKELASLVDSARRPGPSPSMVVLQARCMIDKEGEREALR